MKRIICLCILSVSVISMLYSQETLLEISKITVSKTFNSLSDGYIQKFINVYEGDFLTEDNLEKKLRRGRIEAQADVNILLWDYEYFVEDESFIIDITIVEFEMLRFSFNAFSTGAIFYYRNLLAEELNLGAHMGFARQMLLLNWNRIGGIPLGFETLIGNRLFNELSSEMRTLSVGSSNRIFLWLGNHTKIGLINDIYKNYAGWEDAKGKLSVSMGSFISMDYTYLLDLINIGFTIDTEYRYYFQDINPAHDVDLRANVIVLPFPTNRFSLKLDASLQWSSAAITSRNSMRSSHELDNASRHLALSLPVLLARIEGEAHVYIGLDPGFIIGQSGDENFNFGEVKTALSLGLVVQVGFPASVFFSPKVEYNLSEQKFGFALDFASLPYSNQIDQDW